jgi:hypothetical protein
MGSHGGGLTGGREVTEPSSSAADRRDPNSSEVTKFLEFSRIWSEIGGLDWENPFKTIERRPRRWCLIAR